MANAVKIGNAQGFWGDSVDAPATLAFLKRCLGGQP